MADHENFPKNPTYTQFVLSYELLLLLRWLVDHDEEKFKKIIAKAFQSGLGYQVDNRDQIALNSQLPQEIQDSIVEFFGMLEEILNNTRKDQARIRAHHQNLIPTIDKIDFLDCDEDTLQDSIEQAVKEYDRNPKSNPKDRLFEEVLKRWKPLGKDMH